MISHWFVPDEKSHIRPDRLSKNSLWHQARFLHDEELSFAAGDLLVLSFDRQIGQRIKKQLYQFSATPTNALSIIDCGHIAQKNPESVMPILNEIRSSGAMVILLGPPVGFMRFQVPDGKLTCVIRESNLDDDVHFRQANGGGQFQYIGTQRHLVSETNERIEAHLRLSDLREDISLAEPCIRDAESLIFSCDSMSASEAGYITGMSGSGFSVIEACQLFKYAGAAQSLNTLGIYGYSADHDTSGIMANGIAQMIWYLLEGSLLREDPDRSQLTQYVVQSKDSEHALHFYKSENSGRWWIENKIGRKVPCSYRDYRRACEEDYSDVILRSVFG
jgi:hypothetical protein